MQAVGGDFYDFIPLDDDHLGIAIGDVSDHGVPAAIFMALTVTLLRAEARRSLAPDEVVSRVNQQLLEINDTGMFVTLLYGVLDVRQGNFKYVRAGHEKPIFVTATGDLQDFPKGVGQLVGILDPVQLETQQVRLAQGDTMVLFTDGVTEANDSEGNFFGGDRLREAIQGLAGGAAQAICQDLYDRVAGYRGTLPAQDDTTILVVQKN
jgi:sigma-B regulation protein RsbU (phosphoserine phosphatase)